MIYQVGTYSPVSITRHASIIWDSFLLDPVHFREDEACLLIGSILNFEALPKRAPLIKTT